jgi:hypothetical protein
MGTGGHERARHGEEHHLLGRSEVAGHHCLQLVVEGGSVEVGEHRVRKLVPDRDGLGHRRHDLDWRVKEPPKGCRPGGGRQRREGGGCGGMREEDALPGCVCDDE